MKNAIKGILRRLASHSPVLAGLLGNIRAHVSFASGRKRQEESSELAFRKFRARFPKPMVLTGPFRGMLYPSYEAAGSEIHPKILGSYEKELLETIRDVASRKYTAIVDIGCAEGYYAVGFGMILPGTTVHAFDTNPKAVAMCSRMAELNGVSVHMGGLCDRETLLSLNLGEKALIFCDCEGYENVLFDREIARTHSDHDFLIETHDFLDIGTTQRILSVFGETHRCECIESVDDIIKAYSYSFGELEGFSLDERFHILSERRPAIMRWVLARSKKAP